MNKLTTLFFLFQIVTLSVNGQMDFTKVVNDTKGVENVFTEYEGFIGEKSSKASTIENFDSLGRLIFRKHESNAQKANIQKLNYFGDSDRIEKTIAIGIFPTDLEISDTVIIRYSYNSEGNLSNTVATNQKDSLLWIENFEFNNRGDQVLKSYHKTPYWILSFMPDYLKDSTDYNYEENKLIRYTLGKGGRLSRVERDIKPDKTEWKFDNFDNLVENENIFNEYQYDEKNNWISLKSYLKNKGKQELQYIKTRKIKYRE